MDYKTNREGLKKILNKSRIDKKDKAELYKIIFNTPYFEHIHKKKFVGKLLPQKNLSIIVNGKTYTINNKNIITRTNNLLLNSHKHIKYSRTYNKDVRNDLRKGEKGKITETQYIKLIKKKEIIDKITEETSEVRIYNSIHKKDIIDCSKVIDTSKLKKIYAVVSKFRCFCNEDYSFENFIEDMDLNDKVIL